MAADARVRVLSCVGAARDRDLVGHFARHYRDLGVAPDRIHLIVHADRDAPGSADAVHRLLDILAELGIEPADVWRGVYTSGALWQRRRALQRRVATAEDWVLSADIDEFHVYPAPLSEVVDHLEECGANLLQGPMIDRLAPGGVLAPVDPTRPLADQFPVIADVMCPIGGVQTADEAGGTVKMMLFRGDVLPGIGGHSPWQNRHGPWRREGVRYAAGRPLADVPEVIDPPWRFAQPAAVHHYTWTAGLVEDVRRRRAAPGASARGSAYGSVVIDYLERHGRIRLEDVAVAHAPGRGERLRRRLTPARHDRSRVRSPAPAPAWQDQLRRLRGAPLPPLPDSPRRRPLSEEPPRAAPGWRVRRLTQGTADGHFHAHSYYDIPVLDSGHALIAAHRMSIEDRWMTPKDRVTVGVVDAEAGGFQPIADTTAWSWQQGPLAQWVPASRCLVWNERQNDNFIAHLHDIDSGSTRTLPHSVCALAPDGATALGLNMARLSRARPGYGYFGADAREADVAAPDDDGVWRMDVGTGALRLILPLAEAVAFLHAMLPDDARATLTARPHLYWFNHAKVSPDGQRFTVKLRWRVQSLERPWRGSQSASLTARLDGTDLHLLCRAASHVMWRDGHELICWDEGRERLAVMQDSGPRGTLLRNLPEEVFGQNVHMHPLPGRPGCYLYDVPYAETVQLRMFDEPDGTDWLLAEFDRHDPPHGPFRCDLHPVPTTDGEVTVVTSLHDGGRQIYLLERDA